MSAVDHPKHYNAHPSGIECIQIVEHMGFNLGNAVKYIWRADEKGNSIEDLQKAAWYLQRELERRQSSVVETNARALVADADRRGLVLTIEQATTQPPRMGGYDTTVAVRPKREPA